MPKPRLPVAEHRGTSASISRNPLNRSNGVVSSSESRRLSQTKNELEQALRAVERERDEQSTLLKSTAHGIIQVDPKGRCTFINRAAAEMLGYEPGEVVGQTMHDLCHSRRPDGSPYPAEECPRWNASRSGKAATAAEEVFWRRDGTSFPVEFTSAPIHENGHVNGLIVSLTDISKRRGIDDARKASEARYQMIVESAQEGIWIVDAEDRTTFVNRHLADMFGYEPNEMLGKSLFSFMDEETRAIAEAGMARRREGLNGQRDFRYRRRDGSELWTILSTNPLIDAAGRYVGALAMVSDITERKKAEVELARREGQLAEAQRLTHIGSWELNLATKALLWSDEHYRIFDIDPEGVALTEEIAWGPIHPEDLGHAVTLFNASIRTGDPYETEFRIVRSDGEVRCIQSRAHIVADASGRPARMVGTAQDVTESRQAHASLQESERRLRALVDSLDEIVFEFDGEGTYLNVWAKDESLLAAPREAMLGKSVVDILGEEFARPYLEAFQKVLQSGQPEFMEYSLNVTAGRRDFQARISPVRSSDGSFRSVAMLSRDFTERNNLQEQLRQAQKMEAVGTLAGGVAHDFNNLLTIINGYTELLLTRPIDPGTVHIQLEEIKSAGERAATLVHQLLAFSRRQILELKLLDLNVVVAETGGMLGRLIGEDIELRSVLGPGKCLVRVDPGQISQVILNLATNARDAMPGGGKLTIETTTIELDKHLDQERAEVQPGSYVMLSVSDTGHGMNSETLEHIFEPFFTTKGPGKGTGLGLSTIYGIVKQSGGYVSVASEVGQGTTFKIYFPRVDNESETAAAVQASTLRPRGSETILLVEDESGVRRLAHGILEGSGYSVLEAASGSDALTLIRNHVGAIDLILTDVVMPGMSGRELVDRLSAIRPDARVLYMSGYTDDAIVHHGVLDDGTEFIGKPFTPLALAQKVRQLLDAPG